MDWKERGSSSAHVVPRSFFLIKGISFRLENASASQAQLNIGDVHFV